MDTKEKELKKPIAGEIYQHFNGNFYVIIDSPKDATTGKPVSVNGYAGEEIVWYKSMQTGEVWVRSLAEFFDPITVEGQTIERPRFKLEQFMSCDRA
jgi:hypothetical protein